MARPFVLWPNPILRQPADEVPEITDDVREIWSEMLEAIYAINAVGLAAPQIGIGLRLAVVDAGDGGPAIRLANPEVIQASGEMAIAGEASPNLPGRGVGAKVKRPAEVSVSFLDAHGMRVRQDFKGLWARSVQHQIDHLNGMMYFDRLSRVKRDMLLRRAKKCA